MIRCAVLINAVLQLRRVKHIEEAIAYGDIPRCCKRRLAIITGRYYAIVYSRGIRC